MKLRDFLLSFCIWTLAIGEFTEAVCQTNSASNIDDQSETKKQRTRALILRFFPELHKDSVEGWVDSYSSMTDTQLTELLQQRQMLGAGGTAFPGLKLDLPKFSINDATPTKPSENSKAPVPPTATTPATAIEKALFIVKSNLSGWQVVGHRSRTFHFTHAGSFEKPLGPLAIHTSWNFKSGTQHTSGRRLDLTILNEDSVMFRLEPGCVLTRSGRFMRLPDGRLGQKVGSATLTIFPEVRVPQSSADFQISRNGSIVTKDESDNPLPFQQIIPTRIKDMTRLQSSNGVYFTMPKQEQAAALTVAKRVNIQSGMLELSNVDVSTQRRQQKNLETMSEAAKPQN